MFGHDKGGAWHGRGSAQDWIQHMPDLPTGTVTLLFTDIEGSTKLLHRLGDRYGEVLADYRRVLREAFAAHGGVEVDTQGDAFFVAFGRASDAIAATEVAHRALEDGPVRVRVGIHTGEPIVTEDGYFGMDVHRAARIMSAGHGGQVLVSQSTRDLVDVELRDLGEHRLKDLAQPVRLFQLGEAEFPPLKTLYGSNLPVQLTPLVGRERELAEAGALLAEQRVLTLIGPGGSGKTRLALQLAAEASDHFPDGVYWVSLQALRDPALVVPTIAQTVGAKNGLGAEVGDKRMLLLLDNLEHLLEAAREVAEVLREVPNLKLLATSREPLGIRGERRYEVEPLPADDAAALFLERARAVNLEFEPSAALGEICRRLDGLPLALELAAGRASVLSPEQICSRSLSGNSFGTLPCSPAASTSRRPSRSLRPTWTRCSRSSRRTSFGAGEAAASDCLRQSASTHSRSSRLAARATPCASATRGTIWRSPRRPSRNFAVGASAIGSSGLPKSTTT